MKAVLSLPRRMRVLAGVLAIALVAMARAGENPAGPYERQIARHVQTLRAGDDRQREAAAEALGYLRAWEAAPALAEALKDKSPGVRREAAMGLGWCGGRMAVPPLLGALDDPDWTVRQASAVALGNLTAMPFPFDALAAPAARAAQAKAWRDWWATVPADRAPAEVFEMLKGTGAAPDADNLAAGATVEASTTYKGPPAAVTDGNAETFWQTKNVVFPQHCTIDLGAAVEFAGVVLQQYAAGYCMTDFAISASSDGQAFRELHRAKGKTDPLLAVALPPTTARYVRITSYANERPLYPTTIREIEVRRTAPAGSAGTGPGAGPKVTTGENPFWKRERALRALGVFGGPGAVEAAIEAVTPYARRASTDASEKAMVQAGIRALGRLRDARALPALTALLDQPYWCRYAAEALGDLGDARAVPALVAAFPRYARDLAGTPPKVLPHDDHPGLEPADRMYEVPHQIALALARLPLDEAAHREAVASVLPLLLANLPADFDGALLFEPESSREVAAYLLERTGLLAEARKAAFTAIKELESNPAAGRKGAKAPAGGAKAAATASAGVAGEALADQFLRAARRHVGTTAHAVSWLSALCADPALAPELTALLRHPDGWVRINAAKALMFAGVAGAIDPIARELATSKREADWGYFGGFVFEQSHQGHDEYDDPSPRWRETYARALGRLGAKAHVPLLAKLLDDEANALEVRYAAAVALDEIGTPEAVEVLRRAERGHVFHSIRLAAREAIWRRGLLERTAEASEHGAPATLAEAPLEHKPWRPADGLVFIKGDKVMPNRFQIDPWRQTYSTTDSGPTYRLGRNLYVLRGTFSAVPEGRVASGAPTAQAPSSELRLTQLTHFDDGFVADCEVSWDGRRVVFARRGGKGDPWWHLFEINADGTGLRQITSGPYHDVQPAYLPDGRIVFSSSRIGLRDEYHGYSATGLTVMNADGSDLHCVGFNLGRDNEPAVLADGRIAFSRLELFYSRLKTELTVEAAFPDGTRNVVLYGPERRDFWRDVTRRSGEDWWGEVPPRHRVLRLTQVQPIDAQRVVCASTAGLAVLGPQRRGESLIPHDPALAVTTPFPLGDGRILCAATPKAKATNAKGKTSYSDQNDLGLYLADAATGRLELVYNDPETADFEPRPLLARTPPPVLPDAPASRGNSYTARLICGSARISQEPLVRERGRLVRVVEGMPITGRHANHNSPGIEGWKNHTGTNARVLGTVPLAADGSFNVEVPADRLVHVQVLDGDRRVVGNQLVWMYGRPGEVKSCIGCHEDPHTAVTLPALPQAAAEAPVPCLPTGGEFTYRAKFWNKGVLSDEAEERTRTVRAVNLVGRQ